MNALTNKVEVFSLPLVVDMFEFHNPLKKKLVGKFELVLSNPTLIENSDGDDKFTVVLVILFWKYSAE